MSLSDPNRAPRSPRRFLPYPPFALDPSIPLEVERAVVDGQDETEAVVDAATCRIRPHRVGDWEELLLTLRAPDLRQATAERAGLLVSPDQVEIIGRLVCRETRMRRVVRFEATAELLQGTLRLEHTDVRDKIELQLFAVRALSDARGRAAMHLARHRGSLLALSPIWVIEERDLAMPTSGAFDVAYADFSKPVPQGAYRGEDADDLKRMPEALCHVAFRPEGPLVLLNEHYPDLRAVLFSKGTRGWRARLRDFLAPRIAATVWHAVLLEAWQQVRPASGFEHEDDRSWALRGEEHWTTLALTRAALLRTRKEDEPLLAFLDLLEDESTRAGTLNATAEALAAENKQALPRLVSELNGR
jgi:hypothetical protein